jgi:pentatricopeptide repeat protein
MAPPPAPPAPVPEPARAEESASGELTSPTLAELYFKQGFPDKAVEVYRELVEREPDNDRLRRRLAELQEDRSAAASAVADAMPAPAAVAAPAAGASGGPDRASRRVALERTIARLEGLLAAIKKG